MSSCFILSMCDQPVEGSSWEIPLFLCQASLLISAFISLGSPCCVPRFFKSSHLPSIMSISSTPPSRCCRGHLTHPSVSFIFAKSGGIVPSDSSHSTNMVRQKCSLTIMLKINPCCLWSITHPSSSCGPTGLTVQPAERFLQQFKMAIQTRPLFRPPPPNARGSLVVYG